MSSNSYFNGLFTNAEIAENHVEDILNVNSASESAKRARRQSQFFGHQLLATSSRGAHESRRCLFERAAMPFSRDQRGFAHIEKSPCMIGQRGEQRLHPGAGRG